VKTNKEQIVQRNRRQFRPEWTKRLACPQPP
jgi:hypothetical protein